MIRKFQNPWGTAQFLNRFQFKAFQIYHIQYKNTHELTIIQSMKYFMRQLQDDSGKKS